jgi:hypothetical protein
MTRMCVKSSLFLLVAGLCVGAWANEAEKSETSLVSYVYIYCINLGLCNKQHFPFDSFTVSAID